MEKSFEWIQSAISTSMSQFHLECCEILLDLFAKKYGEAGRKHYNVLLYSLMEKQTFLSIEV